MGVGKDDHADLTAPIARLRASIDRDACSAEAALAPSEPGSDDAQDSLELPQRQELRRQVSALRERVARAEARLSDPGELRAEFATLAFFARMLRQDAQTWRDVRHAARAELRREQAAEHRERRRIRAERERLLRRRDLLQARIEHTASKMAQDSGECRRTVPVITLAEAVTVASVTVSRPRRGLRAGQLWLVTLAADRDGVLVRQD